jgi:hypothetical protein
LTPSAVGCPPGALVTWIAPRLVVQVRQAVYDQLAVGGRRDGRGVGGGKAEGNPTPRARLTGYAGTEFPQLKGGVAGTGFEPV